MRVLPRSPAAARLLAVGEGSTASLQDPVAETSSWSPKEGKESRQGGNSFVLGNPGGETWREKARDLEGAEKVGEIHPRTGGNL